MDDLRALTIKQPWAAGIVHGSKRIENRTQRFNYRGPIAIHAGLTYDRAAGRRVEYLAKWRIWPELDKGAIIGLADLMDCHFDIGCCGQWADVSAFHLVLDNIRPLAEPIPCRGALGLWRPTPETLEALRCQNP